MITTSIVITNYHQKQYIEEAVQSVFAQTDKDWQLTIIDDTNGEDDLYDYRKYDKVWVYKSNDVGLSNARMLGAHFSKGRYLLFLDADDKLHPDFLAKTVRVLDEDPTVSIAYTDTQHFGEADTSWIQPEYNFAHLLIANFMCSCSLIRRSSFDAVGGYNTKNFNYWEDYELWIKMGSKGFYGKHVPGKYFFYRVHKESGMQSLRNAVLSPFYKAHIVDEFSMLYPQNWIDASHDVLKNFPKDFISWKPLEQEKFLRDRGDIK